MIVVDTSVWIDHIHKADPVLAELLINDRVLQHPMVTAEVALGSFRARDRTIALLLQLRPAHEVNNDDLLYYIDKHAIAGTGVGLVDTHLLAATSAASAKLWSRDKRLKAQAERLACAFSP